MRVKLQIYWDDGRLIWEGFEQVNHLPAVMGPESKMGVGPIIADDGDYAVWGFTVEPKFSEVRP